MDLLFVVDDSFSMAEEQANLAANFPRFIDLIHNHRNVDGELLDYRIALTTTGRDITSTVNVPPLPPMTEREKGDNGALRQDCGMTRPWLERSDTNVSGTFACAAEVGIEGPGFEMPLYVFELAFGPRVSDGTNAGFLRDDALLATVILTDEDDCSRRDDNLTIDFGDNVCGPSEPLISIGEALATLDQVKYGRGRWASAVIAAPQDCESAFGEAAEATRLKQFVGELGPNGVFSSICDGDLTNGLQSALATFAAACDAIPPVE